MKQAICRENESGFTLIEIMVAVAILAVISFLLWQSSAVIMNAKLRYEEEDARIQEAIMALTRISDDLSMSYLYQSKDHLGTTAQGDNLTEIAFVAKDGGSQDAINFASMSNFRYIKGSRDTERAEISYFLKQTESTEEDDTGFDLVKRMQSPPDNEPEEGGVEYVVLENVREFDLQFYDKDKDQWKSSWDSKAVETNNKMPRAVEIRLVIPDPVEPEESKTFAATALLEMAPGPNDF